MQSFLRGLALWLEAMKVLTILLDNMFLKSLAVVKKVPVT